MRKKIIFATMLIAALTVSGCSNKPSDTSEKQSTNTLPSANTSMESSTIENNTNTPLALTGDTITTCPFIVNGTSLIYANWEDNNKISIINEPYPNSVLKTTDVADKFDYSTDSLAIINNVLYFADGSKGNNLYALNLNDKTSNKLSSNNVHNITAANNVLYYLDISSDNQNQNKLFSYDTSSNKESLITKDSVGTFVINGDFILYQNLSDHSYLYSIKTDGTQRKKITDYSVNSFTVYENEILAVNSSDNNNLYYINPSDLSSKRIGIVNIENLKFFNNKLYCINLNESNTLYELKVDLAGEKISGTKISAFGIDDYYPTDAGIFIKKSPDNLTPYVIPSKSIK